MLVTSGQQSFGTLLSGRRLSNYEHGYSRLKKMYENIGIHMACGNGSEMTRTSNV